MMKIGDTFSVGSAFYEITEEIAEGGFGKVFKATGPTGTVAVKGILREHEDNEEYVERFKRECRIHANIDHPNVVKIVGIANCGGQQILVQKFIEDSIPLREYRKRYPDQRDLSHVKIGSLLLQALYGLRGIHENTVPQVIHRDVNPKNLIIDEDLRLYLLDFGLAMTNPREETITDDLMGMRGCIAQEQINNMTDVDERADLFSLGRSFGSCLQDCSPRDVRLDRIVSEPWLTILKTLAAPDANNRPRTAKKAIRFVLREFRKHGIVPLKHPAHFEEMDRWEDLSIWQPMIDEYFPVSEADTDKFLSEAIEIPSRIVAAASKPNELFQKMAAGPIPRRYAPDLHNYEDSDNLGDLITGMLSSLDDETGCLAFRLLVRNAVSYHRYKLMGDVRGVLNQVDNDRLFEILEEEDPDGVIIVEGRYERADSTDLVV
jgi:serine/threonine protein kinase